MSLMRQLAGETIIYGLGRVSSKILNFLFIAAYLTRVFAEDQRYYGMYSDLFFWLLLILILFVHRMDTAYFRYGSNEKHRLLSFGTSMRSVVVLSLAGSVAIFVVADYIAALLDYPEGGRYVRYISFILFFDALNAIPFARLRLQGRARRFALLQVLSVVVMISFFLFFYELAPLWVDKDMGWLSRLYTEDRRLDYVFISNIISSGVVFLFLFPGFKALSGKWDKSLWRTMLVYSWPLVLVSFAGAINKNISTPLQKVFLPGTLPENLEMAGIYTAGLKLAIFINLFTEAFNYAAEPFFFKQNEKSNSLKVYSDAARAYAIFATAVIGFTLFFLPYLKHIIDENYWSGLKIVPPLLYSFYLLGLYTVFAIWLKLKDRTVVGAILSFGGAGFTFVISIIFLPKIGIIASVWASVIAYLFMSIACAWWGHRSFPVPYPYLRLFLWPSIAYAFYSVLRFVMPEMEIGLMDLVLRSSVLLVLFALLYVLDRDFILRNFLKQGRTEES